MYCINAIMACTDLLLVMDIYRESEIASAGKHFRQHYQQEAPQEFLQLGI